MGQSSGKDQFVEKSLFYQIDPHFFKIIVVIC